MYRLLDGVRVLDLGVLIPGAMTSEILADLGADVIKVEPPPVGDYLRDLEGLAGHRRLSAQHLTLNRNKRSVTLNVRADGGREVFFDLLRTADVVLDVSVPGARERLGVDFHSCIEVKPDIIYCSLTGYGYTGPLSNVPSHGVGPEVVTGAIPPITQEDGTMTFDLPAIRVGALGSALFAAVGILAALYQRDRTGVGAWIETSQLDVCVYWQQIALLRALNHAPVARPARTGAGAARYNFYRCSDERPLLVMPIEKKFWEAFCDVVERPDLRDRGSWEGGSLDFGDDQPGLEEEIAAELRKRPRAEWIDLLGAAKIPVVPAMTLQELLEDDELAQSRHLVTSCEHPDFGPLRIADTPLTVWGHERSTPTPAPAMGVHTDEVLAQLGYSDERIAELRRQGVVFDDVVA